MTGNPPEPPPSARAEIAERPPGSAAAAELEQEHDHGDPGERIGPVAIVRRVKDDGRALILYSRAAPSRT